MSEPKPERRAGRRVAAHVPVSIKSQNGNTQTGLTRDLSASGMFLYMDAQVSAGQEMEMVLVLPPEIAQGEKRWVCCQASVLRVEPAEKDGRFGVAAIVKRLDVLPEIAG